MPESIHNMLRDLHLHGLESLNRLFWSELNYDLNQQRSQGAESEDDEPPQIVCSEVLV